MPTTDRTEAGRFGAFLALVLVVAVAAGVGFLWHLGAGPLPDPDGCVAEVDGERVELTTEQAMNATTIAAIAVRRGLPARAVSIALATAFQESKLRNIDFGDRDSLGLFQQRPSQGWGTPDEIMDPVYAAEQFYDGLAKVPGYEEMRITEAAQAVQRSGFPEAYEEHAPGARILASALTGWSPEAFTCVAGQADVPAQSMRPSGLTPRAEAVRDRLEEAYGDLSLGGFAPEGVSSGHMEGSAHYDGRAIDVFVRPVNDENRRTGWSVAHFLAAHAAELGVHHVIFDAKIWSTGRRSEDGWRDYSPRSAAAANPATRAILEHRDHVHVDVLSGG